MTDRVLAALAGAVKTFGGHVDKLTGDGIMAVFGAPVAHEDDAERAVRAALAMQRAVRRVLDDERGGGAPLGLRVGLNTGNVVAGIQAALEYTVIGDTVNTAARLADSAAIGTVYAGVATVVATKRVASWRQLRPLRLKGKREPVEAYELLGPRDSPGSRTGLGDEAPHVGRESELGRVVGRLAEVVDRGEPRVLVMTAEAGLGKTRFAGEVERLAAERDARVLSVRCPAYGERRRLAPLADLVRTVIGLPPDGGTTATRAVVEERLRRLAQRVARATASEPATAQGHRAAFTRRAEPEWPQTVHADLLVTLLGSSEPSDGGWVADRTTDADTIPAAVGELLSTLTREAPLVVIVDDLHYATQETVEALGVTLSRVSGSVLVLLLGRPEMVRTAGALTRVADAEVLSLPPLRGADAARLLTSYLGGGRLAQADEDQLLSTAQGNPFYLAELVTLLLERGALTAGPPADRSGSARLAPRGDPDQSSWRLSPGSLVGRLLSRDLAAVLAARIDALPPDARSVLRDAAVVGNTVPATALEALRERRAGRDGRPAAVVAVELERAVEELFNRRMLRRARGGYAFATPLMREAAYAGVGKGDLAERHAYLARWAAESHAGMAPEVLDGFVAEHAERAVKLSDAVGLRPDTPARAVAPLGVAALGRAARRALTAWEPTLVIECVERAARLSGALSLEDRLVHARALIQLRRPAEALAYAEKISVNTTEPATRSGALLVAGRAHRMLGEAGRAECSWQEALEVATSADLPGERAEAMRRLGMADFIGGRLAEAGARFTAAYQVGVAAGDRRSQAWSLQNLAWVTTTRGDFVGADAALGRAARLFAELNDPIGRSWLRGTTAFARLLAGRLGEAQRLARAFLPFGERVGEAWAVGTLRAVDAFAGAERGELAEADREARRAYRDFVAASDDWGQGFALVVRGVVARGLGESYHALDLLTDALGYGERTGHPLLIGMARTIRGLVALDRGDADSAEADARAVLAVVEPHDVLAGAQVGPRVLLACARLAGGDAAMAVRLLAPVAAMAEHPPPLLFGHREAVARYASALLAAGRVADAVEAARRAVALPGEDVRGRVVASRVLAEALAAAGQPDEARMAATAAVEYAYATQQVSERPAADAVLARLSADRSQIDVGLSTRFDHARTRVDRPTSTSGSAGT